MKLRIALGMLVVGMASACGGDGNGDGGGGAGGASGTVNVTLDEMNNSGKSGRAELHSGAASTDVTIEINGQSDNDTIYVHTGTCDAPGEEIVHDLGFTTANLGQGQIFVTLDEVATGEYILDIHDDETDEVIMCGQIPAQ
ncbi:MAG TPA: hypothetical protein VF236_09355 [Gaiellaceae bacterium]